MSRFNLYVDGFNLYHALKAASRLDEYYRHCYWLDLVYLGKWFEQLHPGWKLEKVKFFTAPDRKRPPRGPARRPREPKPKEPKTNQFIYWDALRARGVEIIEGYFRDETLTCKRESCLKSLPDPWDREYADTTEKKTDVALGAQMVCDALTDSIEGLVLITRDADQIPALDLIAKHRPSLFRCVAFPPRQGEYPDGLIHAASHVNDFPNAERAHLIPKTAHLCVGLSLELLSQRRLNKKIHGVEEPVTWVVPDHVLRAGPTKKFKDARLTPDLP